MRNPKLTLAAVLAIGLITCAALRAEPANLLANGNFKKGMEGWTAGVINTAQGSAGITDEGPSDGDRALKITVTTPGENWWDVSVVVTGFALQEGKTYTLRFMANVEPKTDIVLQIQSNDGAQKRTLATQKVFVMDAEWNEYEYVFVAEGSANNALIHFGNMNRPDRTYWLANASLTVEE